MGQGELRQWRSGRADLSCLVCWAASRPASETDQGPSRLAAATYELTRRTWPTSPTPTTISYATGCRSTTTSNPRRPGRRGATSFGDLTAKVVADIGCGNGTYLRALSEAGAVALGLDLSAGMLRAVPDGHSDLALADAQSLPLRTGCVDAAIAMHMLYHVPDPALAVREARRVLRPKTSTSAWGALYRRYWRASPPRRGTSIMVKPPARRRPRPRATGPRAHQHPAFGTSARGTAPGELPRGPPLDVDQPRGPHQRSASGKVRGFDDCSQARRGAGRRHEQIVRGPMK
jgi:SAM-dependent methyltransferase